MNKITCPEFTNLDREIIFDFTSCLQENIEEIELVIHKLDNNEDPELVHELFRSMHSLKGNCRMVLLLPFVYTTHELEEIVSEMRDDVRHYHHFYGSVFISVIAIIENMTKHLIANGECRGDILEKLDELIKLIRNTPSDSSHKDLEVAERVLSELIQLQELPMDFDPSNESEIDKDKGAVVSSSSQGGVEGNQSKNNESKNNESKSPDKPKSVTPLSFFSQLAIQLDCLSIYRQGRTKDVLELCLALNKQLVNPVNEEQLTAAVYVHDVGMAFVPASILNKFESLSKEEFSMIRRHISTGTNLLMTMPGWEDAAKMVAQHHERYDGTGYPNALKGDEIHTGAVLLALSDTYCAVTNERSDRSYKKTLFSAVSLINNESGSQFSPDFVNIFNTVIRRLYIRRD
jgi:HD-GYP domain-containing protein (c-di-GMP phosphodiesterase class II)